MAKPRLRIGHLALLVLLATFPAGVEMQAQSAGQRPGPFGGFRISGKVVSSTTGAPLSQARVTIANARNRREIYSVVTADGGQFEFTHLRAAKYSLEGARRGFIPGFYNQHEQFSTAIVTGPEMDSENLILRLTPDAVITGRILDEAGEPVRETSVFLYRQGHNTGVARIRRMRGSQGDDLGSYEFAELPPGDYFVAVSAKPWYALRVYNHGAEGPELPTAIDPSIDVAYPTTYYPDVTDSDDAAPIPLRGGEHLSIDIHLHPVQALRLTFHVEHPEQGFSPPLLQRRVFDSTEFVRGETTNTNTPGTFEISGIPAGKYTIAIPDPSTGRMGSRTSEIDLNTDGQEIDASSGEPASSVKISVRVVGETKIPAQMAVALQNSDRHLVGADEVDAQGEVNFAGIASGKYTVLASAPGKGYSVIRISSDGSETSGHTLDVAPGSTMTCSIQVIGGSSNVEGVAQHAGKPVSGAMVVLVPKDPEANRELFLRDQSDSDGSFTLPNVVPGSYTVVAIENGWDLDWSQPGVISHYLPKGQAINVGGEAEGSIHLPAPVDVQPR